MKVIFYANGNTGCFDGENQVPILQKSYMQLYLEFLETQGVNPEDIIFQLPNGEEARAIRIEGGWNWSFI